MDLYIRHYRAMKDKDKMIADFEVSELVGFLLACYSNNAMSVLKSLYQDMKIGQLLFEEAEIILMSLLPEV